MAPPNTHGTKSWAKNRVAFLRVISTESAAQIPPISSIATEFLETGMWHILRMSLTTNHPNTKTQSPYHCGWRSYNLSLWFRFPRSQSNWNKSSPQQHNIRRQSWCMAYVGWPKILFPCHAHGASRIYESSQQTHPGIHNAQVWLTQKIHLIWICLHPHKNVMYVLKQSAILAYKDTSPHIQTQETTYIQSITIIHLYYGRAIDHTILPTLNELSSEQA